MNVCTNLGPDPLCRLAAYAGCVMLRALAIADSHNFFPLSQMSVCTNLRLHRSSRLAAYAGYVVRARDSRPPIFIALS
jgi:hypothetical protein